MAFKLSHAASAALSLLSSRGMRSILPSLSLPSSTGLALSAVDSTLWAARAYLFPSTAPAWHAQPALAGLESLPASSSADSAPLPSLLDTAVWTMNRNKRECVGRAWACLPRLPLLPHSRPLRRATPLHTRTHNPPLPLQAQESQPWRSPLQQRAPQAQVRHESQPPPLHPHL